MPLKDIEFSDIIVLSRGGRAFLKGTPDKDQKLVPVPPECDEEVASLLAKLDGLYKNNQKVSLRVTHNGCSYRAAMYNDIVKGHAYFLRRLADTVPSLSDLGFPKPLVDWLVDRRQCKGLLLITGGQGAGKTTTASALIKSRLELHGGHGVSFEIPVEMPLAGHHGEDGYFFQSEIKSESELEGYIEQAHRFSSPNIIFIGEIRSKYAALIALKTALGSSQQLVVATIHGMSITAALKRLLTWAREDDCEGACQILSQTLLGVIHQELSDPENGKRILTLPEYLLVPFDKSDNVTSIRARLMDGNLNLGDDINAQRNYMALQGSLEP